MDLLAKMMADVARLKVAMGRWTSLPHQRRAVLVSVSPLRVRWLGEMVPIDCELSTVALTGADVGGEVIVQVQETARWVVGKRIL